MDYSAEIRFQKILVNMEEAKILIKNNQMGKTNQKQGRKYQCRSTKHLRIISNDCPVGLYYQKAKKLALEMGIFIANTKKSK